MRASYNIEVLKTTLLQALQQTQSETGMFHYMKYCSQRKSVKTGLDALARRRDALLHHQVEKVILLSSQKRPEGEEKKKHKHIINMENSDWEALKNAAQSHHMMEINISERSP